MAKWMTVAYEGEDGRRPFVDWWSGLSEVKNAAVQAAILHVLEQYGPASIELGWGRFLSEGLFEFYVEQSAEDIQARFADADPPLTGPAEEVFLRLFCHAHGDRRILVVSGFDKGRLGEKRQNAAIQDALGKLRDWKRRRG